MSEPNVIINDQRFQDLVSSPLFLIGQVCQNRNSLAGVLVRIFIKDGEVSIAGCSGCC